MIQTEYQDQREDVLGTKREDNLYPVGDPRRVSQPWRDPAPHAACNGHTVGQITFGAGNPQPLPPGGRAGQVSDGRYMHIAPGSTVIGTCSKCRDPVCVPALWGGIYPPTPTCQRCGARKKESFGPVVEME